MSVLLHGNDLAYTSGTSDMRSDVAMMAKSLPGSSSQVTGPQYLPEYLLGDPSSGTATAGLFRSSGLSNSQSPMKNRHSMDHRSHISPSDSSAKASPSSLSYRLRSGQSTTIKPGGPPVQGLYDHGVPLTPKKTLENYLSPPFCQMTPTQMSSSSYSLTPNQRLQSQNSALGVSPAQLDPFYTQGESLKSDDLLDETWVTVFGFPPSAASYILQQFSLYGNIIEHKMSNCGNWVHIRYQSKIQTKKALSKNGKIFGGNIMIGVTQCIDKSVIAEAMKENIQMESLDTSAMRDSGTPQKPSTMRPLTQAYRSAASEHEVAPLSRTPQKKDTMVSKAMEYVFGW